MIIPNNHKQKAIGLCIKIKRKLIIAHTIRKGKLKTQAELIKNLLYNPKKFKMELDNTAKRKTRKMIIKIKLIVMGKDPK